MGEPQRERFDPISSAATIGPAVFLAMSVLWGGWKVLLFYFALLAFLFLCCQYIAPIACDTADEEANGDSSTERTEIQAIANRQPAWVGVTVVGGYLLLLVLCAVAGRMMAR